MKFKNKHRLVKINPAELLEKYYKAKQILEKNNYRVSEPTFINWGLQFKIFFEEKEGFIRVFYNQKGNVSYDYSALEKLLGYREKLEELIEDKISYKQGTLI